MEEYQVERRRKKKQTKVKGTIAAIPKPNNDAKQQEEDLGVITDSSSRKPTFRQRRSIREADAPTFLEDDEMEGADDEDDDEETEEEVNPMPGAFHSRPSSSAEPSRNSAGEDESATSFTYESSSQSEEHAASTATPVEAKVVDDSVVEAEVQARVQAELSQRPLVEAVASQRDTKGRLCIFSILGLVPLIVISLALGLIFGLRERQSEEVGDYIDFLPFPPTSMPSDAPSQIPSQSLAPSISAAPSEAPSIPGPPSVSSQPSSAPSYTLQVHLVEIEVDLLPFPTGQTLQGWDVFVFETVTEEFIYKYVDPYQVYNLQNMAVSADIRQQTSQETLERRVLVEDGSLLIQCDVVLRFRSEIPFADMNEIVHLIYFPYDDDPLNRTNDYVFNLKSNSTALSSIESAVVNVKGYQVPEGDILNTGFKGDSGSPRLSFWLVSLLLYVVPCLHA
jgi:nitroreductase